MYTVYKYTSPSGKVYIGITCRTQKERAGGLHGQRYNSCPAFAHAIQKYGWENFKYEILENGLNEAEAKEKEIYYIKQYDSSNPKHGYNISKGGDGYSIYDKEEIVTKWHEGKSVTEIREEMGCSKKVVATTLTKTGISVGERVQRGIDKTAFNKQLSIMKEMWDNGATVEEIREKYPHLSKAAISYDLLQAGIDGKERIRRSAGQYHAQQVYQYSKDELLINVYDTIAEAERASGVSHSNIVAVCKKRRKTAGGFIWSYVPL